ncbi:MAG TPA: hypothetical protein VJ111_13210 [Chitinophagaceae bacterium]|nr:hypothetical protein [Chitinophagaceae bacterium]
MKQISLALLVLVCCTALTTSTLAQCDKTIVVTSSKTEYLDIAGAIKKVIGEKTVIEITQTSITISPESDHTMTGAILSVNCTWKMAFREGKSEFKTIFKENDESKPITITLEGKDGKISFLAVFDDAPDKRIRVWADSFGEKK